MPLRRIDGIEALDAARWDACFAGDDPFVRHAFLAALEHNRCAIPETGWMPCHLLVEDDGDIVGAAPVYLKDHSWGEFVFDFGWAEASHRLGRPYYPKLVCAVPFTPVTGPRLGGSDATARQSLARGLQDIAQAAGASSVHALFLDDADCAVLCDAGCVERNDIQFHWRNAGYADFDAFLASLSHDKRKKIRRERRRVVEAGLRHHWQSGCELTDSEWAQVYALYAHTYAERGQAPYLTLDFFLDYGRAPGTPVRLCSAFDGRRRVAVAITFAAGDTLYGRHWGAAAHYHSLHFETCYYQGIEYCIGTGLNHFDAGAQGGHKLARGFAPEITRSAHWLADPRLSQAVSRAMMRERRLVDAHGQRLTEHLPYRHADAAPSPAEEH